ncbi:hypothetical protein D3C73_1313140 [compost metagenome]
MCTEPVAAANIVFIRRICPCIIRIGFKTVSQLGDQVIPLTGTVRDILDLNLACDFRSCLAYHQTVIQIRKIGY